jgi:RNA polymerase sigma-70 factor, ECF subfamily
MIGGIMLSRNSKRESDERNDIDLVHAAKLGDLAAFDALIHRHSGLVFRIVRVVVRCNEDAEDVVQEAFLSAFRNLEQFEERALFSTWISRIAYHAALSKVRHIQRMAAVPIDNDREENGVFEERLRDWRPNPEQLYNSVELRAILQQSIASLPERHRIVFVLRDLQELSVIDTAAILGISTVNVKVCLHRARLQLREQLSQHFIGNGRSTGPSVPRRKPSSKPVSRPHLVPVPVSAGLNVSISGEDEAMVSSFLASADAQALAAAGK